MTLQYITDDDGTTHHWRRQRQWPFRSTLRSRPCLDGLSPVLKPDDLPRAGKNAPRDTFFAQRIDRQRIDNENERKKSDHVCFKKALIWFGVLARPCGLSAGNEPEFRWPCQENGFRRENGTPTNWQ